MTTRHVALLIVGTGMLGCGDRLVSTPIQTVGVTGVTVFPSSISMAVGQKATLTATVTSVPKLANTRVRWASQNPAVASVDGNGVVTSLTSGATRITATSLADTLVSGSCLVLVSAPNGTFSIVAINQDGKAADISDVFGRIDVVLGVDSSTTSVSRAELLVNRDGADTVVAAFNRGIASAGGPVTLSFNTVGFKNGQYPVLARLILTNGTVLLSAAVSLTIKNP